MNGSREPQAEKLVEGIAKALGDGEMGAVEILLRLLAVEDPRRAQDVVDTMRLGISLAGGGRCDV